MMRTDEAVPAPAGRRRASSRRARGRAAKHEDNATHDGAGAGQVSGRAAHATRRQQQRFFAGVFGIFGHGNVAGIGQALQQMQRLAALLPVPQRAGDGAHRRGVRQDVEPAARRWPARRSIGPGATNMVTGAAGATINRLPVLLLPGDIFATACRRRSCSSSNRAIAGHLGQRLLQAGVALLGSHQSRRSS